MLFRNRLAKAVAAFATLVVLTGSIGTPPAAAAEPMNVLLIISDDLRCEMGCYGSALASTPHLDALAARGVVFQQAYCQFPLCNPSRTSMLTGRRPTTTGVLGNRTWFGAAHPDWISLPRYFKQHGYATLRAGKIFHGGMDDEAAWTAGGQPRFYGEGATAAPPPRFTRDAIPDQPGGQPLTKAQRSDRWVVLPGDGSRHGDARVADRTIEYLKQHADGEQPFFIGCGFSKPHSPLQAPQRFFDLWNVADIPLPPDFAPRPTVPEGFPAGSIRPKNADLFIGRDATPQQAREMIRAYLASSAWMDFNAGRVLDALDELGLAERTIVVFWGDHGYQLGEKGKWSKAGSLWEQGVRNPLIIYDPRAAGNGQACPRVVEMIDVYPTLVELCGLAAEEGLEGRSLAPLVAKPQATWDHPAYSVWSRDGKTIAGVSVRTERWHFAEFFGAGAGRMLLDPIADPHELHNLADDPQYADVVAELSQLARTYAGRH
ncbi:MAG: sulfatase [Planctomycetaceae bacterium]|nr:sulfatase [Planctomycetaceae bacterium]